MRVLHCNVQNRNWTQAWGPLSPEPLRTSGILSNPKPLHPSSNHATPLLKSTRPATELVGFLRSTTRFPCGEPETSSSNDLSPLSCFRGQIGASTTVRRSVPSQRFPPRPWDRIAPRNPCQRAALTSRRHHESLFELGHRAGGRWRIRMVLYRRVAVERSNAGSTSRRKERDYFGGSQTKETEAP